MINNYEDSVRIHKLVETLKAYIPYDESLIQQTNKDNIEKILHILDFDFADYHFPFYYKSIINRAREVIYMENTMENKTIDKELKIPEIPKKTADEIILQLKEIVFDSDAYQKYHTIRCLIDQTEKFEKDLGYEDMRIVNRGWEVLEEIDEYYPEWKNRED